MLKITGLGWTAISIDNQVVYRGSYLTDIPCDFMKALYDYCSREELDEVECRMSSSVYVDSEGGAANFVFSDMTYSGNGQKVFMFYSDGNGWNFKAFNADPYDLAKELICDVEDNFEKWVQWYGYDGNCEKSKKAIETARENLAYWLNKLRDIVSNQ
ncbi:MAG: hypothetical protein NC132_00465 [Corallococcus sp.]|nr:hypothetical protein [Corallococcus sp.]MCM1359197.1 hypothetical protein [Corallococcus sp.]MCM1394587.1 hypothetical protein [Corallococcus sp.]